MAWNETSYFSEREDIDIAVIGETKLKLNCSLKVRNYITYHTPGPNPTHGGTAMPHSILAATKPAINKHRNSHIIRNTIGALQPPAANR